MKKISLLLALAVLASFAVAACDSGPSDEERMAQQIEGAMQQYQIYAQAYVQQQQAQQQLDELKEKVRVLQSQVNAQNLAVLNLNQMVQQLKAYKDPIYDSEIKRSESAAKAAAASAADYQQLLDEIRPQMDAYQKTVDDATKVINEMKARSEAAAQPAK